MTRANAFLRRTPVWCWSVLVGLAALVLPARALVLNSPAVAGDDTSKPSPSTPNSGQRQSTGETVITGQTLAGDDEAPSDARARLEPTTVSERPIATGLHWLARHQLPDGRWSFHTIPGSCECTGRGSAHCDAAATGLSLLCFLGAGQTHMKPGPYQWHIQTGIDWLMLRQNGSDGDLAKGSPQPMYEHGIATLALCEACAMSRDPKLVNAVAHALRFIEAAQNESTGGWGREPGGAGDTAITAWQVMALKSGQMARFDVISRSLANVRKWLPSVQSGEHHGLFQDRPHDSKGVTPAMTAAGMLCHQYLGTARDDPAIRESQQYLMKHLPDADRRRDTCCWHYATVAMHNFSGREWDTWNRAVRKALIQTQVDKGTCPVGSWDPDKPTSDTCASQGGRLMETSLSVLTLEVYYRYLTLHTFLPSPPEASKTSGADGK